MGRFPRRRGRAHNHEMHRRPRVAAALVVATLLAAAVGTPASASPPEPAPLPVVETIPGLPGAPNTAATPSASGVPRPTPFVAAQHIVEIDGTRPMQWQITPHQVGNIPSPLDAGANLFIVPDDTLVLSAGTAPIGSIIVAADGVAAVPSGSSWSMRAPTGNATVLVFGVGHQDGGTAPIGQPFTVGVTGSYHLEVRGYQLLPGEFADVGDDSMATLLIGRDGVVTVANAQLGPNSAVSITRTTVTNTGSELAVFLAATATLVPDGATPTPSAPTVTDPLPQSTPAPHGTSAPQTSTAPQTTAAPGRAPTANDDRFETTFGTAASGNVLANDDVGDPPAVVVSISTGTVGVVYDIDAVATSLQDAWTGTFVLNADGSGTLTVNDPRPDESYGWSVGYRITNAAGTSIAEAFFVVNGGAG